MGIIKLTAESIEQEHLCCALSEKAGAAAKRAWLKERMGQGYAFRKLGGPGGKVFIETVPSEFAWAPVEAPGYLWIDCFWVSGKFAGQGHGTKLLDACLTDAKEQGKAGLCALSTRKKKPFLSDPGFYKKHGFLVAQAAPNPFTTYAVFWEGEFLTNEVFSGKKLAKFLEGKGYPV